jgi:EmrB/QacA subfamily drug resistance transporter
MSETLPDPRRWLALVVLLAGAFLPAFDFFVVNVALPSLQTELGARPAQLELVIAGYALGFASLLVTGGRLGDLYGRKRMFMAGMAGFTMASALCGLASSPNVLIVSRVLQGVTAALMNPQVLAIIRVTFPEGERSRAIGYFGTTLGLASIAAQLIGGVLIQADIAGLSWRPIFLVNVPIGGVALIASHYLLRDSRATGRLSLDFGGIMIGSAALLLLIYPLVEGREAGWPAWSWIALILSVPCLVAFVFYELALQHRGRVPLVSMRLFRIPGFSLGLIMSLTFFGGLSSFFMPLTVVLQDGMALGPLATGLVFVGFGVGFATGSMVSARIAKRLGPRTITVGAVLMAASMLAVITLFQAAHGQLPNPWLLLPVLALYGLGQGLAMPTLVAAVVGSSRIPPQEAGAAAGVFSMTQQVAFTLGVAVIVGAFFARLGDAPTGVTYAAALGVALYCNVVSLLVTGLMAFALPRSKIAMGTTIHLD